jgi:hypothetical protein
MAQSTRTCLVAAAIVALAALALRPALSQEKQPPLSEHLEEFAPFLGKNWKGEFASSTPQRPMHDISRWERALNGQAVRILHSVNDGVYGGETLIVWDRKKESLVFFYFTTAGFYTQGTMKWQDGKMLSHEAVTGNEQGITEVRATGEVLPDGRLHSKSEYFQNGEWVPGHEVFYAEDPDAKVVFK